MDKGISVIEFRGFDLSDADWGPWQWRYHGYRFFLFFAALFIPMEAIKKRRSENLELKVVLTYAIEKKIVREEKLKRLFKADEL